MTIQNTNHGAPLAAPNEAEQRGPSVFANRLDIRYPHGRIGSRLTNWIHDRLGRQLGKFAPQIERIEVRFEDLNGTKGGVDRSCMVHVVLSALPPVVVEMQAESDHEAFDLAAGRAERATRRNLEKHGFSTGHKKRHRGADKGSVPPPNGVLATAEDGAEVADDGAAPFLESNPLLGSTRDVKPHLKESPGLTLRTRDAVQSPEAIAFRNRAARH